MLFTSQLNYVENISTFFVTQLINNVSCWLFELKIGMMSDSVIGKFAKLLSPLSFEAKVAQSKVKLLYWSLRSSMRRNLIRGHFCLHKILVQVINVANVMKPRKK
jgi:hypothetical protein